MRYKVPQNIDMQDRIIGPLTMIQLIYAIIGGGLSYSLLSIFPKPISYLFAVPIALFTIALIFLKINERPFLEFFISMVQFMSSPKQRVWHHAGQDNMRIIIYKAKKQEKQIPAKNISHEKIHEAAERMDNP